MQTRNIFKKKIYDKVTQDIFDMGNVIIFKETKNGGCFYFMMSSVS